MGVQAPFVSANSETEAFSRRARQTRILVDATRDLTNNPRPSAQQIEAYKELFYQLAGGLLPADRRLVSTLVARSAFTPRAVALYLAQDSLDVAIPCLLYSPVLGELDLKTIGDKMGTAYRDVITKRIVPPLQDGVQEDETTAEDMPAPDFEEANPEPMSYDRPASIEQAEPAETLYEEHVLQEFLSGRANPFGRTPAETTLIEEASSSEIEEAQASDWLNGEEIVALASSGGRLGRQKPVPREEPASKEAPPEDVREKRFENLAARDTRHLLALARRQDRQALTREIGKLSGLENKAITALLRKTDGDEVIYLIKALNPAGLRGLKLLLMIAPRYGRSQHAYEGAKALLQQLDTGICRMIFNQVGATFALPRLETISHGEVEPDTEFARAARFRREEIGRALDGRSVEARPMPSPASQPAYGGRMAQPAGA